MVDVVSIKKAVKNNELKFYIKKLITYILDTENGASLKASGWKCIGEAGGKCWTGVRKPEVDLYPAQMKLRFEIGGTGE